MKKISPQFRFLWIIIAVLCLGMLTVMLGMVNRDISGNIRGFAVNGSGTIGIIRDNNTLIIDRGNNEVLIKGPGRMPDRIIAEDNGFTVEWPEAFIKYDLTGKITGEGELADNSSSTQDLSLPVNIGNTVYLCEKKLGRYSIYEQSENGEKTLRYQMSDIDYAAGAYLLFGGIAIPVAAVVFLVFGINGYDGKNKKWVRKAPEE